MVLPKFTSYESRRLAMRNQIMSYLIHKEAEFMVEHQLTNDATPPNSWHPKFKVEEI